MNRDLTNNIEVSTSIAPQVATGAVNGSSADLRDYDSAAVLVSVGAITGTSGDASVTLEESDNDSDWTDVADADILGTEPTALAAATAYQFGYRGTSRYVRAVFGLGGETNVAVSAVIVGGDMQHSPADFTVTS